MIDFFTKNNEYNSLFIDKLTKISLKIVFISDICNLLEIIKFNYNYIIIYNDSWKVIDLIDELDNKFKKHKLLIDYYQCS